MASKVALIFLLSNVLFFTFVASSPSPCPPPPPPPPSPCPPPPPPPKLPQPGCNSCTKPDPNHDHHHNHDNGSGGKCPTLNLGVCANVLNLVKLKIGKPPKEPCCSLIPGVLDLEAALCLCTNIKLDLLGIVHLNLPLSLELLVDFCDIKLPKDFKCPS
ncbi:putative lipid-binding protein AIR1B [Andrographis paniculata]|uniref:putative lipid-binding protein AIR1B n=1 Tax=Andrographis paniculata TaxID=175694 RepID=UPI0021E88626|nr:putative lipid-binding protein AIR1B [Andrographis paniculata]